MIRFTTALRFWFKLGWISFGGPAGQIALMQEELVHRRRWISEQRFLHALNYCMVLPGPEAQQLATYLGWLMHRTWGGLLAGLLFVLPGLVILIAIAALYAMYGNTAWLSAIFYGIKPAVAAVVFMAAWRLGAKTLDAPLLWALALASPVLLYFFSGSFLFIVAGAALIGWWGARAGGLKPPAHSAPSQSTQSPAPTEFVIGDHTVQSDHTRFNPARFTTVLLVGLLLGLVPMLALSLQLGWTHPYTQMAWFFTKAALVTFGGAYAVLPYVYQGAVNQFQWLSPGQMMDGLALGESTPGPLILVVAFVGFMGAWNLELLGPQQRLAAGVLAACLVTWFTFLPSFIFIFLGAPHVESTRQSLKFHGPLKAISAAVVGVIAGLGITLISNLLLPKGWGGSWNLIALLIFAAAMVALWRYQRSVLQVIALSALLGLVIHWPK